MIEGVPIIHQHPNMPTGCEVTALAMLLRYYGVDVSKEQLGKDMPTGGLYTKNGKTYGPHPSEAFLGSPFSESGFGVYAPVIIEMAEKYLPGRVENLTGCEFEELLQCIDESRPVMIWATINMIPVKLTGSWYTSDGSRFTWKGNEHALVMVGYDDQYIYMNDPYTGQRSKYLKKKVIARWESLGRQAIAIMPAQTYKHAVVDGKTYENEIMIDGDGIWAPVKFLATVSQDITVHYDGGVVSVNRAGEDHSMNLGVSSNYYKVKNDTTYVELKWAKKYLGVSFVEAKEGVKIQNLQME